MRWEIQDHKLDGWTEKSKWSFVSYIYIYELSKTNRPFKNPIKSKGVNTENIAVRGF